MNQGIEARSHQISKEIVETIPSIGIFIDDSRYVINNFTNPFRLPGFRCIVSPVNKGFFPEMGVEKKMVNFIMHLRQTMTDEGLKKVGVVVIDQFYNMPDAWTAGEIFLGDLRTVNKNAWVVEVSAAPKYKPVYFGGNVTVDSDDTETIVALTRKSPANIIARLNAFQTFTHYEMIEAQIADPVKRNERYDPVHGLKRISKSRFLRC